MCVWIGCGTPAAQRRSPGDVCVCVVCGVRQVKCACGAEMMQCTGYRDASCARAGNVRRTSDAAVHQVTGAHTETCQSDRCTRKSGTQQRQRTSHMHASPFTRCAHTHAHAPRGTAAPPPALAALSSRDTAGTGLTARRAGPQACGSGAQCRACLFVFCLGFRVYGRRARRSMGVRGMQKGLSAVQRVGCVCEESTPDQHAQQEASAATNHAGTTTTAEASS